MNASLLNASVARALMAVAVMGTLSSRAVTIDVGEGMCDAVPQGVLDDPSFATNVLTKTGAGTLVLDGDFSFAGTLDVREGRVSVQSPAWLQNAAGVNLADGVCLDYSDCVPLGLVDPLGSPNWNIQDAATVTEKGLEIVPAVDNTACSAICRNPIAPTQAFVATFEIAFGEQSHAGAEGFSFVLQPDGADVHNVVGSTTFFYTGSRTYGIVTHYWECFGAGWVDGGECVDLVRNNPGGIERGDGKTIAVRVAYDGAGSMEVQFRQEGKSYYMRRYFPELLNETQLYPSFFGSSGATMHTQIFLRDVRFMTYASQLTRQTLLTEENAEGSTWNLSEGTGFTGSGLIMIHGAPNRTCGAVCRMPISPRQAFVADFDVYNEEMSGAGAEGWSFVLQTNGVDAVNGVGGFEYFGAFPGTYGICTHYWECFGAGWVDDGAQSDLVRFNPGGIERGPGIGMHVHVAYDGDGCFDVAFSQGANSYRIRRRFPALLDAETCYPSFFGSSSSLYLVTWIRNFILKPVARVEPGVEGFAQNWELKDSATLDENGLRVIPAVAEQFCGATCRRQLATDKAFTAEFDAKYGLTLGDGSVGWALVLQPNGIDAHNTWGDPGYLAVPGAYGVCAHCWQMLGVGFVDNGGCLNGDLVKRPVEGISIVEGQVVHVKVDYDGAGGFSAVFSQGAASYTLEKQVFPALLSQPRLWLSFFGGAGGPGTCTDVKIANFKFTSEENLPKPHFTMTGPITVADGASAAVSFGEFDCPFGTADVEFAQILLGQGSDLAIKLGEQSRRMTISDLGVNAWANVFVGDGIDTALRKVSFSGELPRGEVPLTFVGAWSAVDGLTFSLPESWLHKGYNHTSVLADFSSATLTGETEAPLCALTDPAGKILTERSVSFGYDADTATFLLDVIGSGLIYFIR